jgi:hypothetical protein
MELVDLERKLGIEGLSDADKLEIVSSIQQSVNERRVQQKKQDVAEHTKLVIQAIRKIEADLKDRFDEMNGQIKDKVSSLKDGQSGRDGKDGKTGRDGKDGVSVKGDRGADGKPGQDGQDGVSVVDAKIDFDGSLTITLSNGRQINAGEVVPMDIADRIKVITNGGGTSQYVLDAIADLQTQISAIQGGLNYRGTWNASTNTPTLASSTGTSNYYYVVSVSGSTNLNGITDWVAGDWAIYNGTVWQKIDQTNSVVSVASADGSITVTNNSGAVDLSVASAGSTQNLLVQVRNTTGATLTKGTVVYMSGATGQIPTVSKAIATGDSTSAQTLGMITSDLANNTNGYVTAIGIISEIDTSAFTDGAQLYLSGTTAGTYTATKTYAPTHLVYVGVVEYAHPVHGKIFVKVQNGYELDEIHNVSAQSPSNGQTIIYNATTSLWEKATLTAGTGVSVSNGAGSITVALASGYGDSLNPYASKTANYMLAAPNGAAGVPTFRAMVASDVPTLNQNTTGSAGSLATTNFSIVQSGTKLLFKYGATTIASMDSTGVITSATNIVSNGTP